MLGFLMFLSLSHASDLDLTYTDVKQGEEVPFDGKLFTDDAVIEIITHYEKQLMLSESDCENKLAEQKIDIEYKFNMELTRCKLENESNKELIAIRDKQIKKYIRKQKIQRFSFYGGIVLGVLSTVGVVKALN